MMAKENPSRLNGRPNVCTDYAVWISDAIKSRIWEQLGFLAEMNFATTENTVWTDREIFGGNRTLHCHLSFRLAYYNWGVSTAKSGKPAVFRPCPALLRVTTAAVRARSSAGA